MKKAKQETKQAKQQQGPSESVIRNAFALWRAGGLSLWHVKAQTKIRASVLLEAFKKMASAAEMKILSRGPSAKLEPAPAGRASAKKGKSSKKEEKSRRVA
jgi:hypothetical protein